jgi:two-component system, chemotaxis family, chemotaxis protein CheY
MPIILIIDDYDMLRDVMKMALDDLGLVHTARCGEEALGLLELVEPDVVITDMNMPGMSGLDLIKAVHHEDTKDTKKINLGLKEKASKMGKAERQGAKPKIILYSALMNRELREQARALGVVACFEKPFELEEMRETVREIIGDQ